MELNLDPTGSNAMWTVYVDVEDGPVIQSIHRKDMKVTRLRFRYVPTLGEWAAYGVDIFGARINANGLPGRRGDEQSYGYVHKAPEWVQQAADHYRPKGPAPEPPIPLCVLSVEE